MSRAVTHFVFASVLGSALATGCAANSGDEGFLILNNSAPPIGMCTFSGDLTQPYIPAGFLSTVSSSGYILNPLLESRITALTGQEVQRSLTIMGARVDLKVVSATVTSATGAITNVTTNLPSELTHFQQLVSATLAPSGSANVTFEMVPWAVIPNLTSGAAIGATDRFHATIDATVTMYAEMGGSEVDASAFHFPVTVCNDCLVNVIGACPIAAVNKGNACNPFQDFTVDCCTNAAGGLVCPAM
jgi:hypothetical protein